MTSHALNAAHALGTGFDGQDVEQMHRTVQAEAAVALAMMRLGLV